MKNITLYHGSAKKIEKFFSNVKGMGLYLSESFDVANDYLMMQSGNELGTYGYIYTVTINESQIEFTNDIDQLEKSDKVLFDGQYYRIDNCELYNITELN